MKLNVQERLILINILPKKGDYETVSLSRKTFETLEFSIKEQEELNFLAVFKCEDCGVTNLELAREHTNNRRTDLGRGLQQGEMVVLEKENFSIMRTLVCAKCQGTMKQASQELLWGKVKRKGKEVELVKNFKFSKESLRPMQDALQKPVKTGKAVPVVITLFHKVTQELRK